MIQREMQYLLMINKLRMILNHFNNENDANYDKLSTQPLDIVTKYNNVVNDGLKQSLVHYFANTDIEDWIEKIYFDFIDTGDGWYNLYASEHLTMMFNECNLQPVNQLYYFGD